MGRRCRSVATLSHSRPRVPSAKIPTPLQYRLGTSVAKEGSVAGDDCGGMLWTIAVILLVVWALGLGTSYTAGGLVHLLLVIALIVIVFQFITGRRSI